MLCLFRWKTFYKNNFPHFPVYGNIKKKINQRKTIFSQQKTLIKIKFIFYKLFSKKKKKKENNLSRMQRITPINIIFFWFRKQLAYLAFFTINSLTSYLLFVFLSLFAPSLSPTLTSSLPIDFSLYLPLFSFFSLFLLSFITSFFDKFFFFFLIDQSIVL